MKISNVNKHTSPFWNKVILASAAGSAFIAGYGLLADHKVFITIGGVLGLVGTMGPIFVNSKEK